MSDWGPFSLKGKRTIVTGGAMGIGRGIVNRFVEAGARVLVVDRAADKLKLTVDELSKQGEVFGLEIDLLDEDAPERIVSEAVKKLGGIDVLVNNAGIYPTVPMMNMTKELFDKVYRLNLRALAFLSKAAAAQMIRQGAGGKIVNIASIDSVHPSSVGLAAYDASKGGVLMFTKNFALEMAPHGILVNAIAPGGIATEGASMPSQSSEQMKAMMEAFIRMIPVGRIGQPDDIAKAAVFLASSAADYMAGSLIIVDGGRLLS
ncbi:MAG: SDR family oxidoreductase [Nitrososphaerota archaeon]|jgi:2-deoxy-D-gluconate 3-dehydrogenase|nr:SDR family oxidoreductase [Nitrososphaerota archaeon]MDG7039402.1 SDR family oxidoreductase [Nitrososphaerota archaeon]MDG7043271.1 SDR family oxidoreductase [Nitrososphaerota archaeon]